MPTIDTDTLTTIYKQEGGLWESRTCSGFVGNIPEDVSAGDVCTYPSGGIYQDQNGTGDCFECVGFTSTEVRTLKSDTTIVYVKIFIDFDEQGGTSVANKYVYYGGGRTYGTLPTPTRSGFDFDGWFTESSAGDQVLSSTTVPLLGGDPNNPLISQILYAQWTPQAQQTATPTILSATTGQPPFVTQGFRVRNNDASTATIYAEPYDSTPDVNLGNIPPNTTTNFQSLGCQPGNCDRTVYATAQASGETLSNVRSLYFS